MREFSFDQPAGEILPPETKAPTDSALAIIETLSPDDIFTPGTLDPYLKAFSDAVLKDAAPYTDMTKAPHRDALRTLAAAVGKKKTAIETKRKALVADMVLRKARIDKEGGRLVEIVQGLQDIVRSPLTGWENMEKTRKANHERMTAQLVEWGKVPFGLSSSAIEAIIFQVEAVDPATLEEYAELAEGHKGRSLAVLQTALKQALDAEAQKAENDRLRAEAAERAIQEKVQAAVKSAVEEVKQTYENRAYAFPSPTLTVEEAPLISTSWRDQVHADIRDALALLGITSFDTANKIIEAIAAGKIPHITITY